MSVEYTGGNGSETIIGSDEADTIEAKGGNDYVSGGDGDDHILGGSGNDRLDGNAGDDVITGGDGSDVLNGGSGSDTYVWNNGDDRDAYRDNGKDGQDTIVSTSQNFDGLQASFNAKSHGIEAIERDNGGDLTVRGTDGKESWNFTGADLQDGSKISTKGGNDTVYGSANSETIDAGSGNDYVSGGDGDDHILGGSGNDRLDGNAGDDVITGGDGSDVLNGGSGSDTYVWNNGDDRDAYRDNGKDGQDTIVSTSQNFDGLQSSFNAKSHGIEAIERDNGGDLTVRGTDGKESWNFTGADLQDGSKISTKGGNDTVYGSANSETIDAGSGNDYVSGGEGDDHILGGSGNDRLDGNAGDDVITGGDGSDVLNGGSGSDTYVWNNGDDRDAYRDNGKDGQDTIVSTSQNFDGLQASFNAKSHGIEAIERDNGGDLTVRGTDGKESWNFTGADLQDGSKISTKGGNDTVYGSANSETIDAGSGNDYVSGGEGDDHILGGSGNDRLDGNAGDDVITGGDGSDVLNGGSGSDTYVWNNGDDRDAYRDNGKDGQDTIVSTSQNFDGLQASFNAKSHGIEAIERDNGGDLTVRGTDGKESWNFTGADLQDGSKISTKGGNDTVYGSANSETIDAGSGNDYVSGGDGDDHILGGSGNDRLDGNAGDDVITGGDGSDVLNGGSGSDTYVWNNGDDRDAYRDNGKDGQDTIVSTSQNFDGLQASFNAKSHGIEAIERDNGGDLTVRGTDGKESWNFTGADLQDGSKISTKGGNDTVYGSANSETIDAGSGNDYVKGGDGYDTLLGGSGNDRLYGNTGNDWLNGGSGSDVVDGGSGVDVSEFSGKIQNYEVTKLSGEKYRVKNLRNGEIDTVVGVERLKFDDGFVFFQENQEPVAEYFETIIAEDAPLLESSVVASDLDGDRLVFSLLSDVPAGLTFNTDGTFSFDASHAAYQHLAVGEEAIIQFTYQVEDGFGGSDSQSASIIVTGTNDVPVAVMDEATTDEDTAILIDVLANDTDVDQSDTHTIESVEILSGQGNVSIADNKLRFDPGAAYQELESGDVATVTLSYTMRDAHGALSTATVDINVDGLAEMGLGPVMQASAHEELVNTRVIDAQSNPDTTALKDGGYVVSWTSNNQDGSGAGVYAQRFDSDGHPQGVEFRANSRTSHGQFHSAVASLEDGGFVMTWESQHQDGSDSGIYHQRFDAQGNRVGAEGLVNSYTPHNQTRPEITGLADGGYVITWQSQHQDGSGYGAYAQRYDAQGNKFGKEFMLSDVGSGDQAYLDVTSLEDGGFVATWGSRGDIRAQVFDADSERVNGGEVLVNLQTRDDQNEPKISALSGGGFVVSWHSKNHDGDGYGVYTRRFDAKGQAIDTRDVLVNQYVRSNQMHSSVTGLDDGGYFVTWSSYGQDGDNWGVYGRRYSVDGQAMGNEFRMNNYTGSWQIAPDVSSLEDGSVLVTWHSHGQDGSNDGIYSKIYRFTDEGMLVEGTNGDDVLSGARGDDTLVGGAGDDVVEFSGAREDYSIVQTSNGLVVSDKRLVGQGDGRDVLQEIETLRFSDGDYSVADALGVRDLGAVMQASAHEELVNTRVIDAQSNPDTTALKDGGYVVSWTSNNQDGSGAGVYAQRFDSDGHPQGVEFRANSRTSHGQFHSAVASLEDGGFVMTWESQHQDGSDSGIYHQRFDAQGNRVGAEGLVNSYTPHNQTRPEITGLADGGYVITWQSQHQDGSGYGAYAQRYDAQGNKFGKEFMLSDVGSGDQAYLDVTSLEDGGFVATWGSRGDIRAQVFDADSERVNGGEVLVNLQTRDDQNEPKISALSGGGFVVSWHSKNHDGDGYGVYTRRFDAKGQAIDTRDVLVNQYVRSNQMHSSVTGLDDGGYFVTWSSYGQDGDNWGVYGRRYSVDGQAMGNEFRMNNYTGSWQIAPDVSSLEDGSVLVTWHSHGQDGSNDGIYSKIYRFTDEGMLVEGTNGDDVLSGARGDDTLVGGAGDDVVEFSGAREDYSIVQTSNGLVVSDKRLVGQGDGRDVLQEIETLRFSDGDYSVADALGVRDLGAVMQASAHEELVNTRVIDAQSNPDTTALKDGGYVVSWTSNNQDGSGAGVYAQRFDSDGHPQGVEFRANSRTSHGQFHSAVASLEDGGFVMTWESQHQDGSDSGIYHQRFDAQGNRVGAEGLVNSYTPHNQTRPEITGLADGGYVITWQSQHQDGSGYGAYAQRYDAQGNKFGKEFMLSDVGSGDQAYLDVTSLEDGGFVATWGSRGDIRAQVFDADSERVNGGEVLVNLQTRDDQNEPKISALSGGGFVVSWHSKNHDGDGYGVYTRRFDAKGQAIDTRDVLVNQYVRSNQMHSSVTGLDDGGYFVTWSSYGQDGDNWGVYGRRYSVDGQAMGNEFRMNNYTGSWQIAPDVSSLEDGSVLVTWHSHGQDGSNDGIYSKIYRFTDEGMLVEGTNGDDVLSGARGDDTLVGGAGDDVVEFSGAREDYSIVQTSNGLVVSDKRLVGQGDGRDVLQEIETLRFSDGDYSVADALGVRDLGAVMQASAHEELVNTRVIDAQSNPDTTALKDGGYVVSWTSNNQDGSGAGVYAQRFDSDGHPQGVEFRANSRTSHGQFHSAVASLEDGGFVMTWESQHQDGSDSGIYHQRFDAQGNRVGAEGLVNSYTPHNQTRPEITGLADGGYVITWQSQHQDGSGYGAYAQRYDAQGNKFGKEFMLSDVGSGDQAYLDVTSLEDGGFVATWGSRGDIRAQVFDADSERVNGGEVLVNLQTRDDQNEPKISALSGGGFVVSWHSKNHDGDGYGVYTRRFDAKGQAIDTRDVLVNQYVRSNQMHSSVTGLDDGGYFVTWSSYGQDGDNWGVYGRRYSVDGQAMGNEFRMNNYTGSWQIAPDVSSLEDGSVLVTWHSHGQDGSNDGIYSKIYRFTDEGMLVEGTNGDDVLSGARGDDTLVGGAGDDVVEFSGAREDYSIVQTSNGLVVSDKRLVGQGDGRDVLQEIETLRFSDGDYSVADALGVRDLGAVMQASAHEELVNTRVIDAQSNPDTTALKDGGYVVSWTSNNQDGSGAGVYAQRFDSDGHPQGVEFRANSRTSHGQFHSAVASLEDGGFVMTWESQHQDGSDSGIYHQRFDAQGNRVGAEGLVNSYTPHNQTRPEITGLADGGYVITWQSQHQDGSGYGAYAQRYDAQGNKFGKEFMLSDVGSGDQAYLDVTSLEDGGFVATWGSRGDIRAQVFDADSERVNGGEVLVNLQTRDDQNEPKISALSGGGFVVSWHSKNHDGDGYGVYTRRFDAKGQAIDTRDVLVNQYVRSNQMHSSVTGLDDGGYFVTWSSYGQDGDNWGVYGRRYSVDGQAMGNEFRMNNYTGSWQIAPDVSSLEDGSVLVTWHSHGQDGSNDGIYSKIYRFTDEGMLVEGTNGDDVLSGARGDDTLVGGAGDDVVEFSGAREDYSIVQTSNGLVVSDKRLVGQGDGRDVLQEIETLRFSDGDYSVADALGVRDLGAVMQASAHEELVNTRVIDAQSNPDTTALKDGGYVVSWTSNNQDGSGAGVYAQRFDSDGHPQGVEFRANSRTSHGQFHSAVASLEDGGFVMTWESQHQDGSDSGIYHQRFDAQGNRVGAEGLVNSYTPHNQTRPEITGLADGGYVITWQSQHQDGSGYGAYAQRYDAQGNKFGKEFMLSDVGSGDQAYLDVTSLEDGGFVATWGSRGDIRAQVFDADSERVNGGEVLVNLQTRDDQNEPKISALSGGGFVVSWHSKNHDGDGYGVYTRRFDAKGQAIDTRDVLVNQYVRSNQMHSSVTGLDDGGYFVTWSSYGQDGDNWGVYGRRYSVDGQAMGNEFRMNNYTGSWQIAPDVSSLEDGSVLVTWHSHGQDGSNDGIYSKIYRFTDEGMLVEGTNGDDVLSGARGDDTLVGGAGDDTYLFELGDGNDLIINHNEGASNDTLLFGEQIDKDQLWFSRDGNDLKVQVIGTKDTIVVDDWYEDNGANQVAEFETSTGDTITSTNVENLVQAMASFTAPIEGEMELSQDLQGALDPVIAANWE
ncbi:Ig-like domain-containing protein [Terasakiella sp. SH-1]|uniref:Ig-like domain-containing protein n=1 Tax=Terasakiella sp. SH-1 TaxID=2560057 RepID=UPI00107329CE|nr:Ig-like domain-containing protein [Terasakiella sp. SH-1]